MVPSFSLSDFLELMVKYNSMIWPLQIVAYILGIVVVFLTIWRTGYSNKVISAILALLWLWIGVVFNWSYFSQIYPMARVIAVLFIIEGLILAWSGVFKQHVSFSVKVDLYGIIGGLLVIYAMLGYPAIEYALKRGFPYSLPFGLVPCPTTVFTLGVFLWSEKEFPKYMFVIPLLYALSGFIPVSRGIVEDIGLITAGLVAVIMLWYKDHTRVLEKGRKGATINSSM